MRRATILPVAPLEPQTVTHATHRRSADALTVLSDTVEAMAKQTSRTVGNKIGQQIVRGIFGSIFGGKR